MDAQDDTTPGVEVERNSCFICNEEFELDSDLAAHLIAHSEEPKYVRMLAELEAQLNFDTSPTPSITTKKQGSAFIRTDFYKSNKSNKKTEKVEVVDLSSGDDEPNPVQATGSKKQKINTLPVASGSASKIPIASFKCTTCGAKFNDAASFRTHQLTHGKPRPYICYICRKGFGSKGALRQHLHMHVGDRTHACRFCPKKFTIKSVLRKHEECHELQHVQEKKNR